VVKKGWGWDLFAPGQGDPTGPGQLENSELLHQGKEFFQFGAGSGHLDGEAVRLDVDDFRTENGANLHDLGASLGGGLDPAEDQFAVHIFLVLEVLDVYDVNQLFQLLVDLVEDFVISADHDGHPGSAGIESGAYIESVDVEAPSAEHSGDAGKHSETVFDKDR